MVPPPKGKPRLARKVVPPKPKPKRASRANQKKVENPLNPSGPKVSKDYARRQEKALELNFKDYSEYRRVTEYANGTGKFKRKALKSGKKRPATDFNRMVGKPGPTSDAEDLAMAKLYYQAFHSGDQDDYSIVTNAAGNIIVGPNGKGAKAKWLIEVAGYVRDAADWRNRYSNNVRENGRK